MAGLVVRRLSEATKERLRQRAARNRRSLESEVRAILERAAQETELPSAEAERFPDWFIRMTRPGIDLEEAIDENRTRKGICHLSTFSQAGGSELPSDLPPGALAYGRELQTHSRRGPRSLVVTPPRKEPR